MQMRRFLYILIGVAAFASSSAYGQKVAGGVPGVSVDNLRMSRSGDMVTVSMDIDMSQLDVESNRAVILTPYVAAQGDSVELPSVGVYGRGRYYHYLRANGEGMITGSSETVIRASKKPDVQAYRATVEYEPWMEGASLSLHRQDYGCCGDVLAEDGMPLLADFRSVYKPVYVYVQPKAEPVKARALTGSAYVNFPVNRTEIRPSYMDNVRELGKITGTIDSVKADADITVKALSIKGYASPEGSYAGNERLAKGRTEALKDYVSKLYKFDDGFIKTSYEPENWEGLRRYVEQSNLDSREAILKIMDSGLKPDAKEWKIKSTYPADYRFLLDNCYPSLRRSDYRVEYEIKNYSNPEEIKRVMAERPQKLSLAEFYIAAQSMQPGSREFDDAFETAVRMYPDDETANLNAANSAMKRGDMEGASRYLDKAGQSPEAVYARGVYAGLQGDYDKARRLFSEAQAAGLPQAADEIRRIGNMAQ